MKLVDILARELKVWPDDWVVCSQDSDSYIAGYSDPDLMEFSKGNWLGENNFLHGDWLPNQDIAELASDYATAIVTRAEWQAAVDALNAPKVVEWDGVGNPPVGVDIECTFDSWGYWRKGRVLYYGKQMIFMEQDGESPDCRKFEGSMNPDGIKFRPVRTAEQVAAEEREKAIKEMMMHGVDAGDSTIEYSCAALYDAGYRKEPKPCGS